MKRVQFQITRFQVDFMQKILPESVCNNSGWCAVRASEDVTEVFARVLISGHVSKIAAVVPANAPNADRMNCLRENGTYEFIG